MMDGMNNDWGMGHGYSYGWIFGIIALVVVLVVVKYMNHRNNGKSDNQ